MLSSALIFLFASQYLTAYEGFRHLSVFCFLLCLLKVDCVRRENAIKVATHKVNCDGSIVYKVRC